MRLYDKALVAKIHENQFTKEVDGIPVLFKPVPDAEPAHLDPRLREIIIRHGADDYRLRLTRVGKLILNK